MSFVHRNIVVENIPGKGRGYRAKKDLEIETLLIRENPITISKTGKLSEMVPNLLKNKRLCAILYCPNNYPQIQSPIPGESFISDSTSSQSLTSFINYNSQRCIK
jgi:hypothetical protein